MQKEKYELSTLEVLFYNHNNDISIDKKLITNSTGTLNLIRRSFGQAYPSNRKISFTKCYFDQDLIIYFGDDTHLSIDDCIFDCKLNIVSEKQGVCEISNKCVFNKPLNLLSQFQGRFILSDLTCNDYFIVAQADRRYDLLLKNIVAKQSIEAATNNSLTLDGCKSPNAILRWSYSDQTENHANIENSLIGFLSFDISSELIISITDSIIEKFDLGFKKENIFSFFLINTWLRNISIEPKKIKSFTALYSKVQVMIFSNKNESSNFSMSSCQIKDLKFINFQNESSIRFSNINFDKRCSLMMASSDLNKVDFIKCLFNEGSFIFENSKVNALFLAETDFPNMTVNENKDPNWKQTQLAFGQISSAYSKQGDSVRSLDYHSREIEAHYNSIDRNKEFSVWLNLYLNKVSTNFGRSWLKGLWFTLRVAIVGFFLFYLSLDQTTCGNFDLSSIGKIFIRFLNPIRITSIEEMLKDTTYTATLKSYFIDLISRIFLAYGYYQIIQAFRRYGKFQG